MATLTSTLPALPATGGAPGDVIGEHWRERLLRAYLAIRALSLRFDLPLEGDFFDGCVAAFARAYRAAPKGSRARNVDLLSAVVIYRQSLAAGIPVSKSQLLAFLGDPKVVGAFHQVLATTSRHAPRQDRRAVTSHLVSAILDGAHAPAEVVEVAAQVVTRCLDEFLLTKVNVGAAAVVAAAVLATGHTTAVRLTRIAGIARVAPSAIERCLKTAAARLGRPLPDTPSKCGEIFNELFATGIRQPPA